MQLIRPGTLVPGRELIPARSDIPDGPVVLHAVADEREEAEAVAAEIEKLLGGASFHALDSRAVDGRDRAEHQLSFADFAVLYRTSVPGGRRSARPWRGAASRSSAARTPGSRKCRASPRSWPRLPQRTLSPQRSAPVHAERGRQRCRRGLPSRFLGRLRRTENADDEPGSRAAAIMAIRGAAEVLGPLAARCGTDLDRFLDELALGAEVDTWDPRADRISLLTLHAAKGLEFPVVFIAGCDDGLLPLRSWRGAEVDYAEERRLLFVGMTRATTRLTLLTGGEADAARRGHRVHAVAVPFLGRPGPARRRGGDADRPRRAAGRACSRPPCSRYVRVPWPACRPVTDASASGSGTGWRPTSPR